MITYFTKETTKLLAVVAHTL